MVVPAHTGLEHPNLLWLVGIGLLTFIAGLWVNLSRSGEESPARGDVPAPDEDTE